MVKNDVSLPPFHCCIYLRGRISETLKVCTCPFILSPSKQHLSQSHLIVYISLALHCYAYPLPKIRQLWTHCFKTFTCPGLVSWWVEELWALLLPSVINPLSHIGNRRHAVCFHMQKIVCPLISKKKTLLIDKLQPRRNNNYELVSKSPSVHAELMSAYSVFCEML